MKWLLLLSVSLACASACQAQCAPVNLGKAAEIYGVVRATGSPVAGAHLSLLLADGKKPPLHRTLEQGGQFQFLKLPAGSYILTIQRKGFPDSRYRLQLVPRIKAKPVIISLPIAGAC